MLIKNVGKKIFIKKDKEVIIVFAKHSRIFATTKDIWYDTEFNIVNKELSNTDAICTLIKLFAFDLEIVDSLLKNSKVITRFINENNIKWKFSYLDVSYKYSSRREIKLYYNRDKINKTSIMFLLSYYFEYFEKQYCLKLKQECIRKICYLLDRKESLTEALLAVDVNFEYSIEEATNLELAKYLKAYTDYLYR